MKYIIKKFDNIHQYQTYLDNGTLNDGVTRESSKTGSYHFTHTDDYDHANHLMKTGDREIAEQIEETGIYTTNKRVFATRPRAKMVQSVGGFMPNVPAYLAGAKKQMWQMKKKPVKQRVITVFYNCSTCGSTSADEIVKTSAQLLSAIMQIEGTGTKVNLYYANLAKSDGQCVGPVIKIKDSGQYMDVLKMCYPLVHPSMMRRHFFRFEEVTDGVSRRLPNGGYGHPVCQREYVTEAARVAGVRDARCISYSEIEGCNGEQIIDKIMK